MVKLHNMRKERYTIDTVNVRVDRTNRLLGNFAGQGMERMASIEAYRKYLAEKRPAVEAELERLRNIHRKHGALHLYCWCVPLPCHSELIRDEILRGL